MQSSGSTDESQRRAKKCTTNSGNRRPVRKAKLTIKALAARLARLEHENKALKRALKAKAKPRRPTKVKAKAKTKTKRPTKKQLFESAKKQIERDVLYFYTIEAFVNMSAKYQMSFNALEVIEAGLADDNVWVYQYYNTTAHPTIAAAGKDLREKLKRIKDVDGIDIQNIVMKKRYRKEDGTGFAFAVLRHHAPSV